MHDQCFVIKTFGPSLQVMKALVRMPKGFQVHFMAGSLYDKTLVVHLAGADEELDFNLTLHC